MVIAVTKEPSKVTTATERVSIGDVSEVSSHFIGTPGTGVAATVVGVGAIGALLE